VKLKLTFSTPEHAQNFIEQTNEQDLDNVNISLINFALQAPGLTDCQVHGEAVNFLVLQSDGSWTTELLADPIATIRGGAIVEPADARIKMLSLQDWSNDNFNTWAQVRLANRYLPIDWPVEHTELQSQRVVEVIVMDSGINAQHSELTTANIQNLYKIDDLESFDDDLSHGTAIASLIVGRTLGIQTDIHVKNVKITGINYKPGLVKLGQALDAILDYHNTCPERAKILNLSWIIPKSLYIESKLNNLYNAGVFIVAAAGNTATCIDNTTPAGFSGSFTVAASSKEDTELVAVYGSNKKISCYAPGKLISVANYMDPTGYYTTSGSSFSAAFASAIVAQHYSVGVDNKTINDVTISVLNDCTQFALDVNDKVTSMENKLLHNLCFLRKTHINSQYIGSYRLSRLRERPYTFACHRFIDVPSMIGGVYSIIDQSTDLTTFLNASIDENGTVFIGVNESVEVDQVKTLSFKISYVNNGLTVTTPDLYMFLVPSELQNPDLSSFLHEIEPYDNAEFLLTKDESTR